MDISKRQGFLYWRDGGGGGIVHHTSKKIAHSPLHQILFLLLPHQKSIPPSSNINVQVMTQ